MPEITGMAVAKELRKRNVENPIIFITAVSDFAVQAFGVNATHYLLKPYYRGDFFDDMDKALRIIGEQFSKNVLLKAADGCHNVPINKIIYCESSNHIQRICCTNIEQMYVRCSSSVLFSKLFTFGCCYQCGKTYIVNLEHIDKLLSDSVVMESGDNLVIL